MPLELGVWRIDSGLTPVDFGPLDVESRLEDILDQNIVWEKRGGQWLIIQEHVSTPL